MRVWMHIYVINYGVPGTTNYYCNSDETYEGQMSELKPLF